jgi:Ca-activated chloride channel family protein
MITFKDIELLTLLLLLLPMLFLLGQKSRKQSAVFAPNVLKKIALPYRSLSKKSRNILMILAAAFTIIALARPQINHGEIKVKSSFINIVTAIDMSKSMFADDIYPNRFEFAKNKFFNALDHLKNSKISLIGFSTRTFLISPLTQDFHSLKFLAKNLNLDYLSLKGTNIMATLHSANELFGDEKQKVLLLFTDGGDESNFDEAISYAKEHHIAVYIYNIGTKKGGIIKDNATVLKDKNGDIVVVKRNDAIKKLAVESGGAYMNYSLRHDDIKLLTQDIQKHFKAKEEQVSTIKDTKELFYYPLLLAVVLLFMALYSRPRRRTV